MVRVRYRGVPLYLDQFTPLLPLIGFSPFFFPYFSSLSHPLSSLPLSPLLLLQILWKVDTILFCLLVLRGLSDSQGRVWRFHPTQLYVVEITLPEHQVCCFK